MKPHPAQSPVPQSLQSGLTLASPESESVQSAESLIFVVATGTLGRHKRRVISSRPLGASASWAFH